MVQGTEGLNYVKTTKKQLWDMVKEFEAEAKGSNGTTTTTDVEKQVRIEEAFASIKLLDIKNMESGLMSVVSTLKAQKTILEDLDIAIAEKQAQLKSVYDLEAATNSAMNMIAAKEKLAKEIDEKNMAKIDDANETAKTIIEAAKEEAENVKADSDAAFESAERSRRRMEEQWAYDFERQKKAKWDEFEDKVNEKVKLLKLREEKIADVEELIAEKDAEISELKINFEALEKDIQKRISAAEGKARGMAEREAQHAQALFEAEQRNITKGLETDKGHLMNQLTSAEQRIRDLEKQLSMANERVTTIATGALKAGADAATVTEVAKTVAAGASGKGR